MQMQSAVRDWSRPARHKRRRRKSELLAVLERGGPQKSESKTWERLGWHWLAWLCWGPGLSLVCPGARWWWVDAPPRFSGRSSGKRFCQIPRLAAPLPHTRKLQCTFLKIVVARQHPASRPFEDHVQHPSNQSKCPSARRRSASPARYVTAIISLRYSLFPRGGAVLCF